MRFCRHADVWDVRKLFSVSQIYWIIISSLGIIGGLELLRILGSLWKEKREMCILNIGFDTEQLRTFHILDSLRNNTSGKKEEETLQKLLLKHFEGKSYEKGRITTNIAEAIFFYLFIIFIFINWSRSLGKKTWKIAPASLFFLEKSFFQTLIRLRLFSRLIQIFKVMIFADFRYQRKFPSATEKLMAWGLKNSNLTFVRREIRSILLQYISRGDAVVEFD